MDVRKSFSMVFRSLQRLIMVSEEYRRGWREAQALAWRIILMSRSPDEARRRIRRLREKLVRDTRFRQSLSSWFSGFNPSSVAPV